jgi:hypothetical protein
MLSNNMYDKVFGKESCGEPQWHPDPSTEREIDDGDWRLRHAERRATMSRGHGRIQLQVLDYLLRHDQAARARGEVTDYVSLEEIAGVGASRSRIERIGQAAKGLAAEGLITLCPAGGTTRARIATAADPGGELNATSDAH